MQEENIASNSLKNGQKKSNNFRTCRYSVGEVAWFIESLGLKETAVKFVNETYDFFA
jgi:hypothetical protein